MMQLLLLVSVSFDEKVEWFYANIKREACYYSVPSRKMGKQLCNDILVGGRKRER